MYKKFFWTFYQERLVIYYFKYSTKRYSKMESAYLAMKNARVSRALRRTLQPGQLGPKKFHKPNS